MTSFYTEVLQKHTKFGSVEVVKDLDMLEPLTRTAVESIISDAKAIYGVELRVTETYRSAERQLHLFNQVPPATTLKDVGVHHFGLACDFCKIIAGKASWAGDWTFLRDLAVKHGMISGLDWGHPEKKHTFTDPDHVQRCLVERQKELFAGTWYPAEGLNVS